MAKILGLEYNIHSQNALLIICKELINFDPIIHYFCIRIFLSAWSIYIFTLCAQLWDMVVAAKFNYGTSGQLIAGALI